MLIRFDNTRRYTMRKFIFPAAAVAALAFLAINPAKADAQVIVGSSSGSSYYGSSYGYSPYGYGGGYGVGIGNGGLLRLGVNYLLGGGGSGYSPGYYSGYGGYSSGYRGYSYPTYNRGYSNYGYRGYSYRGGYGGRGGHHGHR